MVVIYDGDCPFCSNFVQMMRLKKAVGHVELVDARSGDPRVSAVLRQGFDLDEGMAVTFGSQTYYGEDAVVLIAGLTPEKGVIGRLVGKILSDPGRAKFLYPYMKAGRRAVLTLLRRPLITPRTAERAPVGG
jgi:predicted DCC family thiol-disulfide oxidoreductase YuxK